MEIITGEKLKQEIETRKNFLKELKKEKKEQEKKYGKAQTRKEKKDRIERVCELSHIEMGVKEEISSIKELLELGVKTIKLVS